jgi:5'-3' exonuclease
MSKFLIIDSMYLTYRSFYAYPNLTNKEGVPTGAFFGYVKSILQMVNKLEVDYLVIARDLPSPTFRHEELVDYKANRKPMEDNLVNQLPLIDKFCELSSPNFFSLKGYEADDIIYSVVSKYSKPGNEFYILSGDRDLYQLFVFDNVSFVKEERGYVALFTKDDFETKYGLKPVQWVDYKALVGDGSDNFKGLPGVGPVTATKLLQEAGSLYNIAQEIGLENNNFNPIDIGSATEWVLDKKNKPLIDKMFQNKDILFQSYMLSKLAHCDFSATDLSKDITFDKVLPLLEEHNLNTLVTYYYNNFGQKLTQEELF